MSNVPSLAAAGSGGPSVMPLFTPPQTPAAGQAQVGAAPKREAEGGADEQQGGNKKRRIAPTPVMDAEGVDVSGSSAPPKKEGQAKS